MSFSHTMPIDIEGAQVQVEFEFSCTPFYPATGPSYASGGEPGGGGEIEIDSATLLIPRLVSGLAHATEVERIEVPAWLLNILGNVDDVLERLGESCDWARDDGPDPDEAYERMRDDGDG